MNIIYFEILISTFHLQTLFTMLFHFTYFIHVEAWFLQSNGFFIEIYLVPTLATLPSPKQAFDLLMHSS